MHTFTFSSELATLLPLIIIGCQVNKLVDIGIPIVEESKLKCYMLQFRLQAGSCTTMCAWTATAIIDHYVQQGSKVFGCALDLGNAFDLVEEKSCSCSS